MVSTTMASRPTSSKGTHVSYEAFAPRSADQVARLSRIAALTACPTPAAPQQQSDDDDYSWLPPVVAPSPPPPIASTYTPAQRHTKRLLEQQLKHTTALRLALRACSNIAEDVAARHAAVVQHSGELSAAADRLQGEAQALTDHAVDIGRPLQHYDAVDRIGVAVGVLFKSNNKNNNAVVRGLAKVKVDDDTEFPELLQEIDAAVVFFGNESGGKQALQEELARREKQSANSSSSPADTTTSGNIEYFRRALALQEAALDLVKEAVAERITTTASHVTAALGNNFVVGADQLEASLVYTRFHGISKRSKILMTLVRQRLAEQNGTIAAEAYTELLQHCITTYCAQREALLRQTVRSHMDELQQHHGAVGMTRLATVFLNRLCTVETNLYRDFFDDVGVELNNALTSLCAALHRTVRRSLVNTTDLDTLCQIVSVLREEQNCASSLQRVIGSTIQDAQERLIFCASTTLKKSVVQFQPTTEDLAYPAKLQKGGASSNDSSTAASAEEQLLQVYESWFPPLRTVLKILSKIFRVVEPRVFEDMALTSVQSCTKSLKQAAERIAASAGELDADLFLVKHLLILREQLSPFDIELRSVERQLDFSDAGKAVARFLANQNRRRVFTMNSTNTLVTLLREGVSVSESSVDSKRDLEDALREACNAFIDHTSRSLAGDLLGAVEELKVSSTGGGDESTISAEKFVDILQALVTSITDAMPKVSTQMALYLDNPATQTILLKPVSRKLLRAVEETRKLPCSDEATRAQLLELAGTLEQAIKKASPSRA